MRFHKLARIGIYIVHDTKIGNMLEILLYDTAIDGSVTRGEFRDQT